MCLIAVAWCAHSRYRLVLAGNRDEYHARPALPLAPWQDDARIVGGRDLEHGGGWLALRGARLAAVTNVRRLPPPEGRSRGALVADFLRHDGDVETALVALAAQAAQYRAFNLLWHDGERLAMATNLPDPHPYPSTRPSPPAASAASTAAAADPRGFALRTLVPGIHGLSNGALDTPWPKTQRLQTVLHAWLHSDDAQQGEPACDALFTALADPTQADAAELPDTGVGIERERWLSSAFIRSPEYGTRASTVVLIADDHTLIHERRFRPDGTADGETRLRIVG